MSNKIKYALFALILIGVADAAYLTAIHYSGDQVACSIVKGCEVVLTSKYSKVMGFPLAALGLAYYGTLFLLLYYHLAFGKKVLWRLFAALASVGIATTAYLVYLQVSVLDAICQYCMLSASVTTIIVALTAYVSLKGRHAEQTIKTQK